VCSQQRLPMQLLHLAILEECLGVRQTCSYRCSGKSEQRGPCHLRKHSPMVKEQQGFLFLSQKYGAVCNRHSCKAQYILVLSSMPYSRSVHTQLLKLSNNDSGRMFSTYLYVKLEKVTPSPHVLLGRICCVWMQSL